MMSFKSSNRNSSFSRYKGESTLPSGKDSKNKLDIVKNPRLSNSKSRSRTRLAEQLIQQEQQQEKNQIPVTEKKQQLERKSKSKGVIKSQSKEKNPKILDQTQKEPLEVRQAKARHPFGRIEQQDIQLTSNQKQNNPRIGRKKKVKDQTKFHELQQKHNNENIKANIRRSISTDNKNSSVSLERLQDISYSKNSISIEQKQTSISKEKINVVVQEQEKPKRKYTLRKGKKNQHNSKLEENVKKQEEQETNLKEQSKQEFSGSQPRKQIKRVKKQSNEEKELKQLQEQIDQMPEQIAEADIPLQILNIQKYIVEENEIKFIVQDLNKIDFNDAIQINPHEVAVFLVQQFTYKVQ